MDSKAPVFLIAARDKTLRYLDDQIVYLQFIQRIAMQGSFSAHVQAVREACPNLSRSYEDDVADMVRMVLKARQKPLARRMRGEAA